MAKKFGKFVLFTAAVAAAGAGVYYYLKNKEALASEFDVEDEDYDDFSDDLEETEANRSYVALSHDSAAPAEEATEEADAEESVKEAPFEKLSSIVSDAAETAEEKVEEFFDEEDEVSEEV